MPNAPSPTFVKKWSDVIAAPTRSGNRVDYLIDGWAALGSMCDAIQSTFKGDTSAFYVYFLGWWLDESLPLKNGDATSIFLQLLTQASNNGVQIRVMVWDNFFKKLEASLLRRGQTPSQQVESINRLRSGAAIVDGHTLRNQSQHQKLLVVRGSKGLIGFCGGIDVARDRIEVVKGHPGSPFHDVHCRIQGDAARDLVGVFVRRWSAHPTSKQIDKDKGSLRGAPDVPGPSPTASQPTGNAYVGVIRTFIRPDGPCAEELSIASTMLKAIAASRRFIYLEDQYLIGGLITTGTTPNITTDAAEALGKALRHLQHITILIPHSAISDLPRVWESRAAFFDKVYSSARREDLNKFRVFYKCGSVQLGLNKSFPDKPTAKDFGPHTYVHSKTWVFDDELAVIGSANLNRRGWNFDSEIAAAIFDVEALASAGQVPFAQKVRMKLWAEHLGLDESQVRDPIGSKDQWLLQKVRNLVRPYDPTEHTDAEDALGWFFGPFIHQRTNAHRRTFQRSSRIRTPIRSRQPPMLSLGTTLSTRALSSFRPAVRTDERKRRLTLCE